MGIFYFLSKKKLSLKHRKYQKTEFTGEMGAREKLGLELEVPVSKPFVSCLPLPKS